MRLYNKKGSVPVGYWLKIQMYNNSLTLEVLLVHQEAQAKTSARKTKAQQVFSMLKPVWRGNAVKISTKLMIFTTNVKSVLLYWSETWRETAAFVKSVKTFVKNVWKTSSKSDDQTKYPTMRRTKQQPTTQIIRTSKWTWIGQKKAKKTQHYRAIPRIKTPRTLKKSESKTNLAQGTKNWAEQNWEDLERNKMNSHDQEEMEITYAPLGTKWI